MVEEEGGEKGGLKKGIDRGCRVEDAGSVKKLGSDLGRKSES